MKILPLIYLFVVINVVHGGISTHESDMNFRVDPGARICFFEKGKVNQTMEAQYQVIDGQHGDLDISFDILDPTGILLVSDYKKSQNSIIMDLTVEGDYVFCLDNSFSVMNSKLVYVFVMMENKVSDVEEAEVTVVEDGQEKKEEEIVEWAGTNAAGEVYYVEVSQISSHLARILKLVVKARHLLNQYGASKSRDSYIAFEDTFIVDMWSAFQICFMFGVGLLQVYMIKKLFSGGPSSKFNSL